LSHFDGKRWTNENVGRTGNRRSVEHYTAAWHWSQPCLSSFRLHRFAQTTPPAAADTATVFNAEQLDALLAPTAFYPDALPAQVLMAANPASWTLHALSD
jgi:uncharacterized protein DUF3300